jgi:uncharacterized membrane protein YagU involved in acid resistance
MTAAATTTSSTQSKGSRIVLVGGLVAGTLDLTAACIVSWLRAGVSPVRVMQSVASGLLGAAAFTGGAMSAVVGVVAHFFIATVWTAVFYLASRRLRFLLDRPVISGLLYGVAVYVFMNFVVIPLSAVPPRATPVPLSGRIIGLLVIMFCIGLPIALIVRRYSEREPGPLSS